MVIAEKSVIMKEKNEVSVVVQPENYTRRILFVLKPEMKEAIVKKFKDEHIDQPEMYRYWIQNMIDTGDPNCPKEKISEARPFLKKIGVKYKKAPKGEGYTVKIEVPATEKMEKDFLDVLDQHGLKRGKYTVLRTVTQNYLESGDPGCFRND